MFAGTQIDKFRKGIETITNDLPREAAGNIGMFGAIQDVLRLPAEPVGQVCNTVTGTADPLIHGG